MSLRYHVVSIAAAVKPGWAAALQVLSTVEVTSGVWNFGPTAHPSIAIAAPSETPPNLHPILRV